MEERTPLVLPGDEEARAHEIGETEHTARDARLTVLQEAVPFGNTSNLYAKLISSLLLVPQVMCAAIVLFIYSNENCSLDERNMSLRTWIIGDAVQKSLQVLLIWLPVIAQRHGVVISRRQLRSLRFFILWNDVFAILWLVQGSTLFSGSGNESCREIHAPHVYNLGLGLLIMSMLSMSLPLILCAAMVPLVCFCLPCFIRVILAARASRPKGASKERLANLPSFRYEPGLLVGGEGGAPPSCAICLASYSGGEEVRRLPCHEAHHFHRQCVDDWLTLNASCPICRKGVFEPNSRPSSERDVEEGLLPE